MRIGGNLLLVALGSFLTFGVRPHDPRGFDVHTTGVILMIIGALGLMATGFVMTTRRRTDVVHDRVGALAHDLRSA